MPITVGDKDVVEIFYEGKEVKEVRLGADIIKYRGNQILLIGENVTTINVADIYPKYNELTVDNFFCMDMAGASGYDRKTWPGYTIYVTICGTFYKSYNPETGELKMYNSCGSSTSPANCNKGACTKIYLVTKPQKLINLGFGETFDVSNMEGYQNFTVDNFLIQNVKEHNAGSHYIINASRTYEGTWDASGNTGFIKSYNPSTGILTCKWTYSGSTINEYPSGSQGCWVYLTKKTI